MANGEMRGNPAVVGLAGFGITTLLLQFHNVGWCDVGPVVALAFVYGGLAQMVAGFLEFRVGNNFGFTAFVSYGAFWISLGVLFMMNHFNVYHASQADVGWFLVSWTVYTFIMWIPAMRINGGLAVVFTLLLIGFILLDIAHFGRPEFTVIAGYELMACALSALYMMCHVLYADVFGRDVLPAGKPWLR
ncbi:MAG: acetate uptake transporter [Desulfobacteraceae bacterium]|nr:acetate uptake transporter [Desulfobacteraceae bacterium]